MNEEDRIALQNEIDILKQVDHPNICKLIEIYEDSGHFYLIMELMTGGEVSLKEISRHEFSCSTKFWKKNNSLRKKLETLWRLFLMR